MTILAHWLVEDQGFAGTTYTCSNCGESFNNLFHRVYEFDKCPKCEAPIIGEIERRERVAAPIHMLSANIILATPYIGSKELGESARYKFQQFIEDEEE